MLSTFHLSHWSAWMADSWGRSEKWPVAYSLLRGNLQLCLRMSHVYWMATVFFTLPSDLKWTLRPVKAAWTAYCCNCGHSNYLMESTVGSESEAHAGLSDFSGAYGPCLARVCLASFVLRLRPDHLRASSVHDCFWASKRLSCLKSCSCFAGWSPRSCFTA